MSKLCGCASKREEEIDGEEFEVETLEDFVEILKQNEEVHLNYFYGKEDLDLWVRVK